MTDRIEALTTLFMAAGKAHQEAYETTDGVDPEWPLFYADYLLGRVESLLNAQPTKSELIYLLVHLSHEQPREAPGAPWARYYARVLVARYA